MATTKENCLHRFCGMCCLESLLSNYHVQLESFGQHNEELVCDCCARFITDIGHLHGLGDEVTNLPSIMFIHFFCSDTGTRGATAPLPQYLADQLTLFQPGRGEILPTLYY